MNFFQRILHRTPNKDKFVGKISTIIGVISTAVISTDYVKDDNAIFVLSIISIVFGGKAIYHAQKILK
jgi:hypothetical protein